MKRFVFTFIGKERGALGVPASYNAPARGTDQAEALLALYNRFEHLQSVSACAPLRLALNSVTRKALAVVTGNWQGLPALRRAAGFKPDCGDWGFADLVAMGRIECCRDPLLGNGGRPVGFAIFYRLAPKEGSK